MITMKLLIHQLASQAGVPTKTIRYYESIGLLPRPLRARNNYRLYSAAMIERLRIIAGARSLGFPLEEIAAILAARDRGKLLCGQTLDSLERRLLEIDRRIADLLETREALLEIRARGKTLAHDQHCDDTCACYHVTADRARNQITITKEEMTRV